MGMTLAKALKCKNRLTQKIGKVSGDISSFNSHPAEATSPVDVKALYKTRKELVTKLSELKIKIIIANSGIWESIIRIAEAKGEIVFWQRVSVLDGKSFLSGGYRDTELLDYAAEFKKPEVDAMVSEL